MAYADRLRAAGCVVEYVEATDPRHDVRKLLPDLKDRGIDIIHLAEPTDDWLSRRLTNSAGETGCKLVIHPSPGFLNTPEDIDHFFEGRLRYHQTDFYIHQRKMRKILLEPDGKPSGGKWTFDTENRKRFPKGGHVPSAPQVKPDTYTRDAEIYVAKQFPSNPGAETGSLEHGYYWGWTHEHADALLNRFLVERLCGFGDFEDAMVREQQFLHHSVLTPMINTGLLTPAQVIERTLQAASAREIPLNDLEGFLRQVVGWREFIRGVYLRAGREQRTRNYWGFNRKIPAAFWTGTTGIAPMDDVIKKVLQTGYAHHIERLMVLGNFFLLCEFDPDEVYRWFMELFIDAYDWVMVPNVYGMTQFADGGLMTTKPYISGSNYILKMSDWKNAPVPATGQGWTETWDALFWRFMDVHRDFFLSNPRLGMLIRTFDGLPAEKRDKHRRVAAEFLDALDKS